MSGASRLGIAALIALMAVSPAAAADLAAPVEPPPPPPPTFHVHAGALGSFANVNAQPTGGGLFSTEGGFFVGRSVSEGGLFIGAWNVAIRPVYTLVLETGYYITPNFAISFATAVPPVTHFKATGLATAPILG